MKKLDTTKARIYDALVSGRRLTVESEIEPTSLDDAAVRARWDSWVSQALAIGGGVRATFEFFPNPVVESVQKAETALEKLTPEEREDVRRYFLRDVKEKQT